MRLRPSVGVVPVFMLYIVQNVFAATTSSVTRTLGSTAVRSVTGLSSTAPATFSQGRRSGVTTVRYLSSISVRSSASTQPTTRSLSVAKTTSSSRVGANVSGVTNVTRGSTSVTSNVTNVFFANATTSAGLTTRSVTMNTSQTEYNVTIVTTLTPAVSVTTAADEGDRAATALGVALGVVFVVAALSLTVWCCTRQKSTSSSSKQHPSTSGDVELAPDNVSDGSSNAGDVYVHRRVMVTRSREDGAASERQENAGQHISVNGDAAKDARKSLKDRTISFTNAIKNSLKRPQSKRGTAVTQSQSEEALYPAPLSVHPAHSLSTVATSQSSSSDVTIQPIEDLSLAVPRNTDILVNFKKAQPPKRKMPAAGARRQTIGADGDDVIL